MGLIPYLVGPISKVVNPREFQPIIKSVLIAILMVENRPIEGSLGVQ